MFGNKIKKSILDALFPIFCLSCKKEGFWLCVECLYKIPILDFQVCPICEKTITEKGFLCHYCRTAKKSYIDSLLVCASYENDHLKSLVHNFKYRFIENLSSPLAEIMIKALIKNDYPIPDYIIPVPLHDRRLRWRGFNQSLVLAKIISNKYIPLFKIEILDILKRKKFNQPQMKLSNYQQRLENVRDIFDIKREPCNIAALENKSVFLIDDITTTGATLEECAKILKYCGARKVFAVVIARQTFGKSS